MREIEKLLRESLLREGDRYVPRDETAARVRFVESLRRRRRMRFLQGGGALVAAALVAALVVPQMVTRDEGPQELQLTSATPRVVATVPVGGEPTAAAVAGGFVWVADTETKSVVAIDPSSNQVTDMVQLGMAREGVPDEIVAGDGVIWVSDTAGEMNRIDLDRHEITFEDRIPEAARLDIAASGDRVWAVGAGRLYQRGPSTETVYADEERAVAEDGFVPIDLVGDVAITDVAVGEEGLFVLYRNEYETGVVGVDPIKGEEAGNTVPLDMGGNADLAVGHGAVWVATGSGGTVKRIDPALGVVTASVEVGGEYADITSGHDAVWAVTGGEGGGRLFQLDPSTGEAIGEPLQLEGEPVDVVTGAGAIWVTDQAGSVLRIERGSEE
jgi:streptogramin lyase